MNRRRFLGTALGAAAAAVAVRFALDSASAAPPDPHPGHGPGDMLEQLPTGQWTSHLLPFAAPFPSQAAVQAELARARALGLFR
jgi:hypothetical protein